MEKDVLQPNTLISNNSLKSVFGDLQTLWSVLFVLVITIILSFLFNRVAEKYIRKSLISHSRDITTFAFIKHTITGIIYCIGVAAALFHIPALKTFGQSLLAGAGILSVVVGLAAQPSLGNFFSGFMIVIFKPFRINDRITIQDKTGYVEDINMRQVVIRDLENNRIIIPNSVMNSEVIVNNEMEDPKTCNKFNIGIGYTSNIDQAFEIIRQEAEKHPLVIDHRTGEEKQNNVPRIVVKVVDLADSSVNLTAWIWSASKADGVNILYDLRKSIKEKFDAAGIEIPFPQRVVTVLNGNQNTSTIAPQA